MEQKLEETTTKNQTLQEQLDALTAEKSQASEHQSSTASAALARVVELENELQITRESSRKVEQLQFELEERTLAQERLQKSLEDAKRELQSMGSVKEAAAPVIDEPGDDGWGDFGLDDVQKSSPQPKVQAAPIVDEPGDDGWGDFGLDDVQKSSPQPKVQAAPVVDEPGDDGWGDFGLEDVQKSSPQVKADAEPQGDDWGMLDLDLGKEVNAPRDPSSDVLEMQHAAEQLSAASARVAELEQQLKNAGEYSAKVEQLQLEAEQKLEESTMKNQTLQEELDVLRVENDASEIRHAAEQLSAASARVAELEQQLKNAGEYSAKVAQLQLELEENRVAQEQLQKSLADAKKELQSKELGKAPLETQQEAARMPGTGPSASTRVAGDDGWDEFGLDDVQLASPQPNGGNEVQPGDAWGELDLDLEATETTQAQKLDIVAAEQTQVVQMQQSAELSAVSARVAELEKQLKTAGDYSSKVEQLKSEMEQKLEETTVQNQTLQEQLDNLTAEQSQASEMQHLTKQLSIASARVAELEDELQMMKTNSAKANSMAAQETPAIQAASNGGGDDGWDDFDFDDGFKSTPVKNAPVPDVAAVEGGPATQSGNNGGDDGWDDFDFDDGFKSTPATVPDGHLQVELERTNRELKAAKEALAIQKQESAAAAAALEERWRRRFEELGATEALEKTLEENDPAPAAVPAVSMFSTATRLLGTATSVAAAARAAAEQWSGEERPKEAGTGGQSGWEAELGGDGAGAAARKHLEEELEVLKSRLAMAHDQLQAERKAQSAMKALSSEVSSLAEVLAKERQEHEREKANLREMMRQAKEDLRQQSASSLEGDGMFKQLETLRRQRDQARGIAQLIASQLSNASRSPQPEAGSVPATDPERTLHSAAGVPAAAETVAVPPVAAPSAVPTSNVDEGDERSVPRPPVEITSGWDVFNPDDQLEHTIPTGRNETTAQDGWGDFDFDELM